MARQRAPRAEKRFLLRWTDDLDKKLLLAVQYQCNVEKVHLPWDAIGKLMGDNVTGGAVIQHLAKVRARMVASDLSVPPPLTRGGHITSSAKMITPKAPSVKRTTARAVTFKAGNPRLTKRKAGSMSEESDDTQEESQTGSEAEYDPRTTKRSSTNRDKEKSGQIKKLYIDDDITTHSKRDRSQCNKSAADGKSIDADLGFDEEGNMEKGDDSTNYVGTESTLFDLADTSSSGNSTMAAGTFERKSVARESLIVKLMMQSQRGRTLLRITDTAWTNQSSTNSPSYNSIHVDDFSDTGSSSNGSTSVGLDINEEDVGMEARRVEEDQLSDLEGAAGVLAEQCQYVPGLDRYAEEQVLPSDSHAFHGLPIYEGSPHNFIGYHGDYRGDAAFNYMNIADPMYHGGAFVTPHEYIPSTPHVNHDLAAFPYHDDTGAEQVQIQTEFGLMANPSEYYAPRFSIVNRTAPLDSISPDDTLQSTFQVHGNNYTTWTPSEYQQEGFDLKPALNGQVDYAA